MWLEIEVVVGRVGKEISEMEVDVKGIGIVSCRWWFFIEKYCKAWSREMILLVLCGGCCGVVGKRCWDGLEVKCINLGEKKRKFELK